MATLAKATRNRKAQAPEAAAIHRKIVDTNEAVCKRRQTTTDRLPRDWLLATGVGYHRLINPFHAKCGCYEDGCRYQADDDMQGRECLCVLRDNIACARKPTRLRQDQTQNSGRQCVCNLLTKEPDRRECPLNGLTALGSGDVHQVGVHRPWDLLI